MRSFKWPPYVQGVEQTENPYYFAFQAIINVLNQHQHKLGIDQPIDFVFDDQVEKRDTILGWDIMKKAVSPDMAHLMGSLLYQDGKEFLPLQAADLYAWWVRRWIVEGDGGGGIEHQKYAWKAERDIPRLQMSFTEEHFTREFEKAVRNHERRRLIAPPYDAWLHSRFDLKK